MSQFSCVDGTVASVDIKMAENAVSTDPSTRLGLGTRSEGVVRLNMFSHSPPLVILVGTYGGEIIEVKGKTGTNANKGKPLDSSSSSSSAPLVPLAIPINLDLSDASAEVLLHSHHGGELWALAAHPVDEHVFASAGDEGSLRLWSVSKNCLLGSAAVGHAARALAWHPSGAIIAVGFFETVKGGYKNKGGGGGEKNKKKESADAKPAPGTQ